MSPLTFPTKFYTELLPHTGKFPRLEPTGDSSKFLFREYTESWGGRIKRFFTFQQDPRTLALFHQMNRLSNAISAAHSKVLEIPPSRIQQEFLDKASDDQDTSSPSRNKSSESSFKTDEFYREIARQRGKAGAGILKYNLDLLRLRLDRVGRMNTLSSFFLLIINLVRRVLGLDKIVIQRLHWKRCTRGGNGLPPESLCSLAVHALQLPNLRSSAVPTCNREDIEADLIKLKDQEIPEIFLAKGAQMQRPDPTCCPTCQEEREASLTLHFDTRNKTFFVKLRTISNFGQNEGLVCKILNSVETADGSSPVQHASDMEVNQYAQERIYPLKPDQTYTFGFPKNPSIPPITFRTPKNPEQSGVLAS